MSMLTNRKGTILVATYMVLCVIIVVASSFFSMVLTDNKTVSRDNNGARALSNAERGIVYAYYEAYNLGWDWRTHKWNGDKTKLNALGGGERIKTRPDCDFDADGFLAHNSGDFKIKAYDDVTRENDTVVVSMGTCGDETRVLMYYLTRRGIYDFFLYTPYDLDLDSAVGRHPRLNGGGIHSNGNIRIDGYVRLEDISELSAGADGSIYYRSSQYQQPLYADRMDDGIYDGRAPITRLDQLSNMFRDDSVSDPGPFGYYNTYGNWGYRSGAYSFVHTDNRQNSAFRSTEIYFAGDKLDINQVPHGGSGGYGTVNDSGGDLNYHNLWVKPYVQDDEGVKIPQPWQEIDSEMENDEWAWDKYGSSLHDYESPVSFYTYKDDGSKIDVADTLWEFNVFGDVEMLDPPIGGDAAQWTAFNAAHPTATKYWDMYQKPEFWKAQYGGNSYYEYLAETVNPEVMDDGTYGTERLSGDILNVKHTNSMKQPDDWKNFAMVIREVNILSRLLLIKLIHV